MNYAPVWQPPKPCSNCGERVSITMCSPAWGHAYACCSDACGERLAHRLRYGFKAGYVEGSFVSRSPSPLRIEIKRLRHRLKEGGQ